jgi:WD40 repeat protein/DNA-binding SARP family transcriptional activator
VEISVLGPVEVSAGGRPVAIGAGKPRALLAMLALHEGSTVTTDRLVEGLWGEQPPATAAKMVQLCVSQLRRALPDGGDGGWIVTRGRGYELRLGNGGLDARRFERLIAEGRPREALALWRGAPLADVADEPFAAVEIRRLEELRLTAIELAIDGDLAAGRHREVVGELEGVVAAEPLRERLHAQRMLALYRCGRQAEALDVYRQARRALVEAIGVEPGPELRRMQEAILRQDPSLEPPGAAVVGLPVELDAGTPLAGRAAELDWLREHWRSAHAGAGRLVLVAGERGIGKTRLAAELAGEVHRDRGAVLYASGAGPAGTARAAVDSARAARRPTLLVLDDVDRAGGELRSALAELHDGLAALAVLVVATGEDPGLGSEPGVEATLTLAPLDADGVAAVARLYAREDAEVPVARLVKDSGGVPQRVHRAAGEWARTQAARRLGAAVDRAASERAGLRAAEDEVAGTVVELQAVSERAELRDSEPGVVACPFKGLAAFDVDDAGIFFGRERLVAEMVARLVGAPLLGVVGPSGSGKSSALRAGLLAALAAGVLPGSEGWALGLARPGEHPLRALERALAAAAPRGRLIVAVDQFEEAFTACREESERAAFVDALLACARDPRRRALVLVAVRADFYGRCAAYPELSRLLGANHVLVGPMRRDELRRAIELPARRSGLRVEPELVDALIADVEGEPGALPLLSTSLLELWQHRDGRCLRLAAYEHAGGVRGAVARLAESAYERLDGGRREIARALLLRLAGGGEGDAVVRRRVPLAELEGERDEAVGEVLSVLAADRLVTIGAGEVEVAHEALLREWPRLRGWLEEDAEGRRLHRHLIHAARDWQAAGRDRAELYRGARLASALDWVAGHEHELNELECDFIAQSRAEAELEAERQRRANRRLRALLASLAALLALAAVTGVVALNQRGQARDAALVADAQRLGAQALAEDDLDRSLLLARQGVALHDSPLTQGNLLAALLKSPAALGVVRGNGDRLISLDLSPDGRTLAVLDDDGMVTFVDTQSRHPVGQPYIAVGVGLIAESDDVRFSPDGTLVAVGGTAPAVLDARTHRQLTGLRIGKDRLVSSPRFSPDGRTLFAVVRAYHGLNPPVRIQRFDAHTGRALGPEALVARQPVFVNLMVTRDGRRLVTTSSRDRTTILDARALRPLKRLPGRAERAALSPDDRTMLVGGRDGSVRFLDLDTGKIRTAFGRHTGPVLRAAFSADGRTAITASEDSRAIVWNVERPAARETFDGHTAPITGLAIRHETLYTAALDGKVIMWDLDGAHRLGRPFAIGPDNRYPFQPYAMRPDGRVLAVGHRDGTVTLIDARTLEPLSKFRVLAKGPVLATGYVPGGRLLVVGGDNGFLALVDPHRGTIVKRLPGHRGPLLTPPRFSADGRLMATTTTRPGALGPDVILWALPSGKQVARPPRSYLEPAGDVSLSPDGRTLAIVHPDRGVEIIDVTTLRQRARLPESETVDSIRFTPDGRSIVGGSDKGWARLWSTKTWRPATRALAGHAGAVLGLSTSPDGRTLATGSTDGTIRLYDLPSQQPLGAPLPAVPNRPVFPQFTSDGAYLFAITNAGRAYRWDVRPFSWARHACAVAGRTLTRTEWMTALPGRDYAPACTR